MYLLIWYRWKDRIKPKQWDRKRKSDTDKYTNTHTQMPIKSHPFLNITSWPSLLLCLLLIDRNVILILSIMRQVLMWSDIRNEHEQTATKKKKETPTHCWTIERCRRDERTKSLVLCDKMLVSWGSKWNNAKDWQ